MSIKTLAPSYFNRMKTAMENIGKGRTVLNVGCGDGEYDRTLSAMFSRTVGVDINRSDIMSAKLGSGGNNHYAISGGEELPFRDNSFDAVICMDVLEHIRDDKKVVSEIFRVLKDGGNLVLSVPHSRYPWTYDPVNGFLRPLGAHLPIGMWGFGHLRLYSRELLTCIIEGAGFSIEKMEYLNHYLAGLLENYLSFILSRSVKPDPTNRSRPGKPMISGRKAAPGTLQRAVAGIIKLDNALFKNSGTSVGLLIKAKKQIRQTYKKPEVRSKL